MFIRTKSGNFLHAILLFLLLFNVRYPIDSYTQDGKQYACYISDYPVCVIKDQAGEPSLNFSAGVNYRWVIIKR